jgi:hypothetical protein
MLSTSQLLPDLTIDTVSRFSENFGVPPFFVVAWSNEHDHLRHVGLGVDDPDAAHRWP